jgi:hypothetical protein
MSNICSVLLVDSISSLAISVRRYHVLANSNSRCVDSRGGGLAAIVAAVLCDTHGYHGWRFGHVRERALFWDRVFGVIELACVWLCNHNGLVCKIDSCTARVTVTAISSGGHVSHRLGLPSHPVWFR